MLLSDRSSELRFLQNAALRQSAGDHVIVIVNYQDGKESFDLVDGVRVEHFVATPAAVPDKILSKIYDHIAQVGLFVARLNKNRTKKIEDTQLSGAKNSISTVLRIILQFVPNRYFFNFAERSLLEKIKFYRPDEMYVVGLNHLRLSMVIARKLQIPMTYEVQQKLNQNQKMPKLQRVWNQRIQNRLIVQSNSSHLKHHMTDKHLTSHRHELTLVVRSPSPELARRSHDN